MSGENSVVVQPSAQKVFHDFVEWNNEIHPSTGVGSRGYLSAHTAYLYGLFWSSYTDFLLEEQGGVHWFNATSNNVEAFLNSIRPRSRREGRSVGAVHRQTSSVTRQRYETVIHRVYAFAVSESIEGVQINPVHLSRIPEKRKREDADSFLLHASYREKLLQGIDRCASNWAARDAALLALMSMQGLTPSEIVSLQCAFVEWAPGDAPPVDWIWETSAWDDVPRPVALHVPSVGRDAQARRLVLDELSQVTLQNWLRWRGPLLPKIDHEMIFLGQRGVMSTNRIYEIASQHILSTLVNPKEGVPSELTLYHAGPMTLRTSALMAWMERIDNVQEVLRLGGLADVKSLERIARHASEAAAQRYRKALEDTRNEGQPNSESQGAVPFPGTNGMAGLALVIPGLLESLCARNNIPHKVV
jgi:site-specific recombinase XerD